MVTQSTSSDKLIYLCNTNKTRKSLPMTIRELTHKTDNITALNTMFCNNSIFTVTLIKGHVAYSQQLI